MSTTATSRRDLSLRLIRLAIVEARDSTRHSRATGETRRYTSPLPQRRHVRLYNRAYVRALRSYA